ncbi:MAG TPA: hypothetical protein VFO82_06990 [Steroidobacteraceae bacterium]|nr:hypothetical protein [Steroidobacteraceae bacterium]
MSDATLAQRLDAIEAGYEYCLAYAAQGRADDAGTPVRQTLAGMFFALEGLVPQLESSLHHGGAKHTASTRVFLDAVKRDAAVAQGAIGLVLDRPAIGSLLVDNLNASIHLRALLTDLFLIDQAISARASSPSS